MLTHPTLLVAVSRIGQVGRLRERYLRGECLKDSLKMRRSEALPMSYREMNIDASTANDA
jgi:hypothetical protein